MPTIYIAIILIFFIIILYYDKYIYETYLNGFWKGDIEYCNKAGIDDMVLYLNTEDDIGQLIISKNDELLENTSFAIKKNIINKSLLTNYLKQYIEYDITFIPDKTYINFCWDNKKFKMIVSIFTGTILIYEDDELYAKLFKQNEVNSKFMSYLNDDDNDD